MRFFLTFIFVVQTQAAQAFSYEEIGVFNTESPAFLNLDDSNSSAPSLLISSFKPKVFSQDAHSVTRVDNLLDVIDNGQKPKVTLLDDSLVWPNQAIHAYDVFGQQGVIVANGFFDVIPLKHNSTGSISFFSDGAAEPYKLTKDKKGFYYHRALWVDLMGNGEYGYLTARTNSTPMKHDVSELVYLTPPASEIYNAPWNETVIYSGAADINFDVADLDNDGQVEIYAAEFFNQALSVIYRDSIGWQRRIIDDSLGAVFDVEVTQLNNRNEPMLLVTNHTNKAKLAGVFAYQVPTDITHDEFTKHVLWQGIKTKKPGFGQASPGKALPFYTDIAHKDKPRILVSGDGAEIATVLVPVTENPDDWQYYPQQIFSSQMNSIIGQPAVLDAIAERGAIALIPEYDNNQIHVIELN